MAEREQAQDIRMDANSLYREEVYTDRRVGTIHRMIPVNPDGSDDEGRKEVWVGQAQLMTPAGALPLHFELEADNLDEAIRRFGDEAAKAAEDTMERLKELRREAASSIYTPDQGGGMGGFGGQGGQSGVPGGGIKMP